jgi:hypothetical protein
MVPLGVQLFIFETESAASAGESPQTLAGKAEKAKRRKIALPALCVNWCGADSSLKNRKLRGQDWVRKTPRESRESRLGIRWQSLTGPARFRFEAGAILTAAKKSIHKDDPMGRLC